MTENKRTVNEYMDGFRRSDHEQILSCLTDDVEWEIPGAFHVRGKRPLTKRLRTRPLWVLCVGNSLDASERGRRGGRMNLYKESPSL
jgi:hypothetical protein